MFWFVFLVVGSAKEETPSKKLMLCIQVPYKVNEYLSKFHLISFFTVRLHDSIQEENYHYLVFDLYVEKYICL